VSSIIRRLGFWRETTGYYYPPTSTCSLPPLYSPPSRSRFNKRLVASITIGLLLIAGTSAIYVMAQSTITTNTTVGTNTVTALGPSTATVTTTSTATNQEIETDTNVIQPVQGLTTVTETEVVATTTSTITTTAVAQVLTTETTTATDLLYEPFVDYYVWHNNTGLFRSLNPISATTQDGDTVSESATEGGVSFSINQASTDYNDLGFYYGFDNLNLGALAGTGTETYSIAISGTGTLSVNLWINPQDWTWVPSGESGMDLVLGLGSDGATATGASSPSSISGSTSFELQEGVGSCAQSSIVSIVQLVSMGPGGCGLSPSTIFALWIGVGPIASGTVSATVAQVSSSPYP